MVLNDLLSILNIHTRIQLIRVIESCPRFEIDPADEFGNIKIKTHLLSPCDVFQARKIKCIFICTVLSTSTTRVDSYVVYILYYVS